MRARLDQVLGKTLWYSRLVVGMSTKRPFYQDLVVHPREIWATLALVSMLVLIYVCQLIVSGSFEDGAAYSIADGPVRSNAGLFLILSPLLHASHGHLLLNLANLFVAGSIFEIRDGHRRLLLIVYLVGAVSNFLPPLLGYGNTGLGVSGSFYALWIIVGISSGRKLWEAQEYKITLRVVWSIWSLVILLVGVAHGVTAGLQYLGLVPVSSGSARAAHLTGVILGMLWVLLRPHIHALSVGR
jgi:membrane associated rhomboid family serine protease